MGEVAGLTERKCFKLYIFSLFNCIDNVLAFFFFWSQIPNIGQQEATQAVQTLADVATHHDLPHGLTAQPITMEMNPETGQVTTLPFSQGHQIILADDSSHIGGRL